MNKKRIIIFILVVAFLLTSCSLVDKVTGKDTDDSQITSSDTSRNKKHISDKGNKGGFEKPDKPETPDNIGDKDGFVNVLPELTGGVASVESYIVGEWNGYTDGENYGVRKYQTMSLKFNENKTYRVDIGKNIYYEGKYSIYENSSDMGENRLMISMSIDKTNMTQTYANPIEYAIEERYHCDGEYMMTFVGNMEQSNPVVDYLNSFEIPMRRASGKNYQAEVVKGRILDAVCTKIDGDTHDIWLVEYVDGLYDTGNDNNVAAKYKYDSSLFTLDDTQMHPMWWLSCEIDSNGTVVELLIEDGKGDDWEEEQYAQFENYNYDEAADFIMLNLDKIPIIKEKINAGYSAVSKGFEFIYYYPTLILHVGRNIGENFVIEHIYGVTDYGYVFIFDTLKQEWNFTEAVDFN